MKKTEDTKENTFAGIRNPLATLLVLLSISFVSNSSFSQQRSSKEAEDIASSIDLAFSTIAALESEFGAYDQRQLEPLGDQGLRSHSDGYYEQALVFLKQALYIVRINRGLYHPSQISIVDGIIDAEIAMRNWQQVDDYYAYQEHLYRRLYTVHDPRLEVGLQKVTAWHVNALNANLDGRRIEHLRQANKLFKVRMQIAEHTLSVDDPKFAILAENIKICEKELFQASDWSRELMTGAQKQDQPRHKSQRQNEPKLIVSLD